MHLTVYTTPGKSLPPPPSQSPYGYHYRPPPPQGVTGRKGALEHWLEPASHPYPHNPRSPKYIKFLEEGGYDEDSRGSFRLGASAWGRQGREMERNKNWPLTLLAVHRLRSKAAKAYVSVVYWCSKSYLSLIISTLRMFLFYYHYFLSSFFLS